MSVPFSGGLPAVERPRVGARWRRSRKQPDCLISEVAVLDGNSAVEKLTWHPTRMIFCLFPIASPRALGTPRDASPPHRTRAPRLRLSGTRRLARTPLRALERARRVSSSTHRGNHEKRFSETTSFHESNNNARAPPSIDRLSSTN